MLAHDVEGSWEHEVLIAVVAWSHFGLQFAVCLDVVVDGQRNADAAWYYPEPEEAAAEIEGRVAFWRGVEVG